MSRCISPEQFQRLLAEQLSPAERDALEAHIETCATCEQRLARLLDDSANDPAGIAGRLRGQAAPAPPFLRRLQGRPPPPLTTAEAQDNGDASDIHFPEPPTALGPLGQLESYHIVAELGRGAFGVVFKAHDANLNCLVALKVLRPEMAASASDRARFEREARAAAAVRDDHVVTIHRVGTTPGFALPYLVMEYIDGEALGDRLERHGVLGPREAAVIARQVALGLATAHSRGLVHRDIKPNNIMLERGSGRAKITDFGLARAIDVRQDRITQSGGIVGTPAYMSPEQILAPQQVDGRSDLYGLGVVLYEALTGETPFRGQGHLILQQVVADEPVPPRRRNDAIPRDLETITLQCLAKEPGRRYQTAGELAADLQRWLDGEPIRARPVGSWERAWKWARRRPAAAALLLVSGVAVLALGGVGTGSFFYTRLQEAFQKAEQEKEKAEKAQLAETQARQEEEEQRRLAQAALKEAKFHQYFHHIARAQMGLREGDLDGVEQLLEECPLDQRRWEWDYLKRQCHADLLTLKAHNSVVISVAFSPEGTRLASAGEDQAIKIWDMTTGQEILTLTGHTGTVWNVAFSSDGTRLASASADRTVRVWDTATGQEALPPLKGHTGVVRSVAFSPDGTRLASTGQDLTVRVWSAATGQEARTLTGHTSNVLSVAFSPDGTLLASASEDRKVKLWDATTGRWIRDLTGHHGIVSSVAFSPDGTRLVSAGDDRTIKVWDATTSQWIRDLKGHADRVLGLTFSPDGRRLASSSMDRTVKVWDATTGEVLHTLKGHTRGIPSVAFHPAGTWLASASMDQTVKIWDATTAPEARTLTGHTGAVFSVAFSLDGTRLASAGQDRTIKVWEATSGQVVRTLSGHTMQVFGVAFSPDGTRLVSGGGYNLKLNQPGEVKIWDATTGQEVRALKGLTSGVFAVVFSPDGSRLACGNGDGTVKLWDATTAREARRLDTSHAGRVWSVAFSPDGTQLASVAEDQTVKVWNATTGQELLSFKAPGHLPSRAVAFSPEGTHLAAGWDTGTVRIWDVRTGQPVHTLTSRAARIDSVAFSLDGTRLAASGAASETVEIWDATAGLEVLRLGGHTGSVRAMAFNRAGTQIASAGLDGTVKIWDARPWTPKAAVEAAVERNALGLLDFLFTKPLSTADVLEHLQSAPMLRPLARQLALELVKHYREETKPEAYHQASWAVARQSYLNAFQYGFALQQAKTASQLAPDQANYRTVLGMAQYRLGRYQEALATLTRPDRMHAGSPADLAFLAMTQHRLGQTEQSRATLAGFRERLSKPEWTPNEELQAFLREAEKLMGGQPALPKE